MERNIRGAALVAEVTVPGWLIEIGCQLSRERRLGRIVFIYLHAIEYVSVHDRLVSEGKIHDSFVIRCACQRGVPAGVDCIQRVISFGFQISFLMSLEKVEGNRGTSASDGIHITRDRRVSAAHVEVHTSTITRFDCNGGWTAFSWRDRAITGHIRQERRPFSIYIYFSGDLHLLKFGRIFIDS